MNATLENCEFAKRHILERDAIGKFDVMMPLASVNLAMANDGRFLVVEGAVVNVGAPVDNLFPLWDKLSLLARHARLLS